MTKKKHPAQPRPFTAAQLNEVDAVLCGGKSLDDDQVRRLLTTWWRAKRRLNKRTKALQKIQRKARFVLQLMEHMGGPVYDKAQLRAIVELCEKALRKKNAKAVQA